MPYVTNGWQKKEKLSLISLVALLLDSFPQGKPFLP